MESNLLHKDSDEARRQLDQLEGAESSESESEEEEEQGEPDKKEVHVHICTCIPWTWVFKCMHLFAKSARKYVLKSLINALKCRYEIDRTHVYGWVRVVKDEQSLRVHGVTEIEKALYKWQPDR